ncbi:flippase [Limibacter armeniacum]|uniref:flippase n=1 Tax=Limibacter armeniacum TaxID=466084 RepID=UPI002FE524DC
MLNKITTYFNNLRNNRSLMEVANNANWLMLDRVMRIVLGLLVNAWVRRYLGPDEIGKWDFVLAISGIFVIISALGLEQLVTRELVNTPKLRNTILGTAFSLRLVSGIITSAGCIGAILLLEGVDPTYLVLVGIAAGGILVQATEVIVFFNQSLLKARNSVLAKGPSFFIFSIIKVGLILTHQPLVAFAWAYLGEMVLSAILLLYIYQRNEKQLGKWHYNRKMSRKLLSQSWPLMAAGIAYMMYMRIDQVMLGTMMDAKEVGLYATATKLYEVPLSVLTILGTTFFPKLTEFYKKGENFFFDNYRRMVQLMTLIAYLGLVATVIIAPWFIPWLYGEEYHASTDILLILMVGIIFMYNGGLRGSYLTISNQQRIILWFAFGAPIINIGFNLLLIPKLGGKGAALASVITQIIVTQLFSLFFSSTRKVLRIQLRSLLLLDTVSTIKAIAKGKQD